MITLFVGIGKFMITLFIGIGIILGFLWIIYSIVIALSTPIDCIIGKVELMGFLSGWALLMSWLLLVAYYVGKSVGM